MNANEILPSHQLGLILKNMHSTETSL